ncbi:MAG: sugar phosphate isomerase/epimerase [Lachnospiraceae bacterium]|nr:sugar phosphate isomerase/epimerase [Lachnospiraceae bacterium]
MVNLGLNTWLWANKFEKKHLFCIDKAYELGAEAIDFSVNDPFGFPTKDVAQRVKQYDMEVIVTTAMPADCNAISPDPEEREKALDYMKKLLDIAGELGSGIVGGVNYVGSGYHTGKPRTQQEIEWDVEYLRAASEYASQYGVDIALEAVKRFETHFVNTAAQAMELIRLADRPNLKVHLDTFHMNIEEADFAEAIESCGEKLAYMHLIDSNRGAPGMGHVPWVEVFRALKKIGYEGVGCIETFNPETLEETCSLTYLNRKFADTPEELAKQGLTYLKAVRTMVYGA